MRWWAVVLASTAAAQDGQEILRKAAETYRSAPSYEYSGTVSTLIPDTSYEFTARFKVAQAGPKFTPQSSGLPMLAESIQIGWPSYRDTKTGEPASPKLSMTMPGGLSDFGAIDTRVQTARRLGDEEIRLGPETIRCYVVEAVYGGEFSKRSTDGRPIRYWIEQASGLVRRLTFTSGRPWTATVESAKLGQPPPDWLIQMAPRMAGRRNDKWAGREAPQFGEMSRMRGRVLVLNFWATWCGQCREEMPVIEKLRAEYRNRGVEVWGVTNEPPDKALRWMKNYGRSLPTLFGDNAFELYEVQSIPVTVVIDRKGLVQSYFVGLCGAADLRAAIDAALLN